MIVLVVVVMIMIMIMIIMIIIMCALCDKQQDAISCGRAMFHFKVIAVGVLLDVYGLGFMVCGLRNAFAFPQPPLF